MKADAMNLQKPEPKEKPSEQTRNGQSKPQAKPDAVNGAKPGDSEPKASVRQIMDSIAEAGFEGHIKRARKLKSEGDREGCLDVLDAMVRKGKLLFGDFDVRLAGPFFRLGDVLLQAVEDTDDVFGGLGKKGSGGESGREEEIRVAWENLEIARVILEKHLGSEGLEMAQIREGSLLLADVFKRLGECENLKENFAKAREELKKGIELLERVEDVDRSRVLSEHCYLMSRTLSYEGRPGHAKEAKVFIGRAIRILETVEKESQGQASAELKMVLEIMRCRRDDLQEELEATDPGDPKAIKEAIARTKFSTATSFPKSQLKGAKVHKLGSFGKGRKLPQLAGESAPQKQNGTKKVQMEEAATN